MSELNRPLRVFLCHAHVDRDAVHALYTRLTNDGVDVWLDKEKLLPGQDWELEIRKAVREADVVVVCLSKQFNRAGYRQKEVRIALNEADMKPEGEIFIIPARLEECENLDSLRKWHWVDLSENDGYSKLLSTLSFRADFIGAIVQARNSLTPKKHGQKLGAKPIKPKDEVIVNPTPDPPKRIFNRKYIILFYIILVVLFGVIYLAFINSPLVNKWLTPSSDSTPTSTDIQTIADILTTPTTQLLYVYDLVLPSGHTPPDANGNTSFAAAEIPEQYEPLLDGSSYDMPIPVYSPKHAVRIQIPIIGVDAPIVQGDGWEQLKMGVGQRLGSANPGEFGNIVLSAHNDVYGEIFRSLDQLERGDEIILITMESSYLYIVDSTYVVEPTLVEMMANTARSALTLITSYPYLVDNQRLVVKASPQVEIPTPSPNFMRIGIVSGHWGNDLGAVCPNGITEAAVNLNIATIVQQKLFALGFDVNLLKEFDPLLPNYEGVVLISIHSDSCDYINEQATGFKVVSSASNSDTEKLLMSCLVGKYGSTTGLDFYSGSITVDMSEYHTFSEVDKNTPIAIIETGFLYKDYDILINEAELVADGIVKGIICFGFADD